MKKLVSLSLAAAMLLSLSACGGGETSTPASSGGSSGGDTSTAAPQEVQYDENGDVIVTSTEKVTLKLGHTNPETSVFHEGAEVFKEEVEAMTNGNITVELYPSSQLGDSKEIVQSTAMGAVELNISGSAQFSVFNEELMVLDLPFLFAEREKAYEKLDGEAGEYLAEGLIDNNIKVLGYLDGGYRCMFNSERPLNHPADFQGLSVRVQDSEVYFNMMDALGALPSFLPWGDLYVSISQGVVEAGEGGLSQIYTQRFYEVAPYVSLTNHTLTINPFVINKDKWDSLPADYQAVLEVATDRMEDFERQRMAEAEEESMQLLLDEGVQINEVDPAEFQEAMHPVWDTFAESYGQDLVDMFSE